MKLNKCFLFMLILICSLFNISGNNSPVGIGESSDDCKRKLEEQIDNYIIIQFNKDFSYNGGIFLHNSFGGTIYDYNPYISYIINGDEKFDRNSKLDVKKNTKLEVHFNQTITTLESFFDTYCYKYSEYIVSADFCHFDTLSVTNMKNMF